MSSAPTVGVLALQGGVAEHLRMLESLGARAVRVRSGADLVSASAEPLVDALVLPGGESSTVDRLTRAFGLAEPLKAVLADGLPVLGTCAGLIMLATDIEDPAPGQRTLGALDITVVRNAFGSQVDSAEATLPWGTRSTATLAGPDGASSLDAAGTATAPSGVVVPAAGPAERAAEPRIGSGEGGDVVRAAFIRAPAVTRVGPGVEVLAHYRGRAVAVRQGNVLGISFHPELTGDATVHRELLGLVAARRPQVAVP